MLRIIFKSGKVKRYKEKEYTDYLYNGKVFAVIKKKRWIGTYNMDYVKAVEYKKS